MDKNTWTIHEEPQTCCECGLVTTGIFQFKRSSDMLCRGCAAFSMLLCQDDYSDWAGQDRDDRHHDLLCEFPEHREAIDRMHEAQVKEDQRWFNAQAPEHKCEVCHDTIESKHGLCSFCKVEASNRGFCEKCGQPIYCHDEDGACQAGPLPDDVPF